MSELLIRNMRREELNELVEWAALEGWNPGLSDADIFWATDPEAFIAAELSGQLIGGGSIVSYGGRYGFMGFFIIRPEFRGKGLGNKLWHERLRRLKLRLQSPAQIGMDGVFDMQAFYAKGGFEFSGRDLRFEGLGKVSPVSQDIMPLADIAFTDIDTYDRSHFPAPRPEFLKRWISQPNGFAMGIVRTKAGSNHAQLSGYGVMRPCQRGYKIGPLFADDPQAANDLFSALLSQVPDEPVFLDIPEANPAGLALAHRYGMTEVFGCAKMYFGAAPGLPIDEIYGITTFEFG